MEKCDKLAQYFIGVQFIGRMRVSKTPELGSTPSAPADSKKYHPITISSYETVFFYCFSISLSRTSRLISLMGLSGIQLFSSKDPLLFEQPAKTKPPSTKQNRSKTIFFITIPSSFKTDIDFHNYQCYNQSINLCAAQRSRRKIKMKKLRLCNTASQKSSQPKQIMKQNCRYSKNPTAFFSKIIQNA